MVSKYTFLKSYQVLFFLFACDTKIITTIINAAFSFALSIGANGCNPLRGLLVKSYNPSSLPVFFPNIYRLNMYT